MRGGKMRMENLYKIIKFRQKLQCVDEIVIKIVKLQKMASTMTNGGAKEP
jgi:hypothetical protein